MKLLSVKFCLSIHSFIYPSIHPLTHSLIYPSVHIHSSVPLFYAILFHERDMFLPIPHMFTINLAACFPDFTLLTTDGLNNFSFLLPSLSYSAFRLAFRLLLSHYSPRIFSLCPSLCRYTNCRCVYKSEESNRRKCY